MIFARLTILNTTVSLGILDLREQQGTQEERVLLLRLISPFKTVKYPNKGIRNVKMTMDMVEVSPEIVELLSFSCNPHVNCFPKP